MRTSVLLIAALSISLTANVWQVVRINQLLSADTCTEEAHSQMMMTVKRYAKMVRARLETYETPEEIQANLMQANAAVLNEFLKRHPGAGHQPR